MDKSAAHGSDLDLGHELRQNDQLSRFRDAVGINNVIDEDRRQDNRKDGNVGIYRRVVAEESKARVKYHLTSAMITTCLLMQVVFAAILTALGASQSPHIVITVFGALNTAIAGLLSFTKGKNLPNRFRQYQNSLRKVREYIELRERSFYQPDSELDLRDEVQRIIDMYEAARQTEENNDPAAYVETGKPYTAMQAFSTTERKKSLPSDSDFLSHAKGKLQVSKQRDGSKSSKEDHAGADICEEVSFRFVNAILKSFIDH